MSVTCVVFYQSKFHITRISNLLSNKFNLVEPKKRSFQLPKGQNWVDLLKSSSSIKKFFGEGKAIEKQKYFLQEIVI